MCGFAGYIKLDGKIIENSYVIDKMLQLQKHRGPDDSGIIAINSSTNNLEEAVYDNVTSFSFTPDIVFGFNRLSILDLSINGHQPMICPQGDVVLMMNGEVYNAFEFKDELFSNGVKFKSETDTEVVLNLYLHYGIEGMLNRLDGMFSIVIYDFKASSIFIVRDRFGIKPLYLLEDNGIISFSSELKSFKAIPDFKFKLDVSQLNEFLIFRNCINGTLIEKIKNVEPGTYYQYSIENKKLYKRKYFDIELSSNQEECSLHELKKELEKSVSNQMISDVKLGTQLSGGVDSSLVTFYASKVSKKGSLESVSIVFDNSKYNEESYIDYVTKELNLVSHKFKLENNYYLDNIEKAIWHFEQPLNHPNTIGIYLLSQKAKEHVTVLLSGEGADECLAGYSRFLWTNENLIFSKTFIKKIFKSKSRLKFLRLNLDRRNRIVLSSSFGDLELLKKIWNKFDIYKGIEKRKKIYNRLTGSPLSKQRKYEIKTFLPDLLIRQDKMSMAHSIENRVPFLSNALVSKSLSIKDVNLIKIVNGKKEGKAILKELCKQIFSHEFAYRKKKGFGIPLKDIFVSDHFSNKWKKEILPGIKRRAIFDYQEVDKLVDNVSNADPTELEMIWLMTNFEIWAQLYLDDDDSNS